MEYINEKFSSINIWSAGHYRYVTCIECEIFKSIQLDLKKTNTDCELINNCPIKELGRFKSLKKSLLIDDREDVSKKNPNNYLLINRYEPDATYEDIIKDDNSLLKIIEWFKTLEGTIIDDVRLIDKPDIF